MAQGLELSRCADMSSRLPTLHHNALQRLTLCTRGAKVKLQASGYEECVPTKLTCTAAPWSDALPHRASTWTTSRASHRQRRGPGSALAPSRQAAGLSAAQPTSLRGQRPIGTYESSGRGS